MHRERREIEYPVELESQFILRLPEEPARILRELLRSGGSLKDRISIQLENDVRYGEVRLDHRLMHAKLVDLPTIVESLKTIDNKSFYKTADICQMLICKDEPEQPTPEEESPNKNKKKDPYKVDKKFLWPHGVTPPSKNVRKRRFRKTLKKKYVEAPEIEKEVKRLLRTDNEAVSVTWEVIKEEEETPKNETATTSNVKSEKASKIKHEKGIKADPSSDKSKSDVVDIFGGAVSDSDMENEDDNMNPDMEDSSRLSNYDSRLSDSSSMLDNPDTKPGKLPTQFRSEMFHTRKYSGSESQTPLTSAGHSRSVTPASHSLPSKSGALSSEEDGEYQTHTISKETISCRIEQLTAELEELKQRRQRTQHEISGMENLALRQRFQDILQNLQQDIVYKEMELRELQSLQNQTDEL